MASARNIYLDGNNISFREGVDDKIVFGSSNIDGEKEQSYMVSKDIWIGPTAPNEAGASNSHRLEVNQDGCFADGYEICTKNTCLNIKKMRAGTKVVGTDSSRTSIDVFTSQEFNGDGAANSVRLEGATYQDSKWRAVTNVTNTGGAIRINYLAVLFG